MNSRRSRRELVGSPIILSSSFAILTFNTLYFSDFNRLSSVTIILVSNLASKDTASYFVGLETSSG